MENKLIYLDNAATTKPYAEAIKAFTEMAECFANPSSLHRLVLASEKQINKAKEILCSSHGLDKND